MPAKNLLRVAEEGSYLHVFNKGIEDRIIFNDKDDFETFRSYLGDYLSAPKDPESVKTTFQVNGKTFRGTPHQPKNFHKKVELIAYSITPDHFHLILHQAKKGSVENFIRSLCTRYSIYFNKKYSRSGSLFAGPYKSIPVDGDSDLLVYLTHHLHHEGKYTSYTDYISDKTDASWVKFEAILSSFENKKENYKYFIEHYQLKENQKGLIAANTFHAETVSLERRHLTSVPKVINKEPSVKRDFSFPLFIIGSFVPFIMLIWVGFNNIQAYAKNIDPIQEPQVLGTSETDLSPVSDIEEPVEASDEAKLASPSATIEASDSAKIEGSSSAALNLASPPTTKITVMILDDSASSVNIREKPSLQAQQIGKAYDGEVYESFGKQSGWYSAKLSNGTIGYISEDFAYESRGN